MGIRGYKPCIWETPDILVGTSTKYSAATLFWPSWSPQIHFSCPVHGNLLIQAGNFELIYQCLVANSCVLVRVSILPWNKHGLTCEWGLPHCFIHIRHPSSCVLGFGKGENKIKYDVVYIFHPTSNPRTRNASIFYSRSESVPGTPTWLPLLTFDWLVAVLGRGLATLLRPLFIKRND